VLVPAGCRSCVSPATAHRCAACGFRSGDSSDEASSCRRSARSEKLLRELWVQGHAALVAVAHPFELAPPPPRVRRRTNLAAAAVVLVLLGAVVAGWWSYFRVGLFGAYDAGYAAVAVDPSGDGTYDMAPCDAALRVTFPDLSEVQLNGVLPSEAQAFDVGCSMKRWGLPADPWSLHEFLGGGGAED
jgi:hypothetical protein